MDSRYPLASSTWNKSELKSINKVIDSGIYSMGKFVAEFEETKRRKKTRSLQNTQIRNAQKLK